jgi:hypothetical protein
VLTADALTLALLVEKAHGNGLLAATVTDAAQESKTYADYATRLAATPTAELQTLGVAVLGPAKAVNKLTGSLRLLR